MPVIKKITTGISIAGVQKLTTIDFPNHIAAVLFTGGCPWSCRYCHNSSLRYENSTPAVDPDSLHDFLDRRKGYLDGIVVSGGEPTLHDSLPELLTYIREFGYNTAIHTNGFYPNMLKKIIDDGLVDYIALDIKGPPRAYDRITQCSNTCFPVSKSIQMTVASGIDYEFRTTYHHSLLSEEELLDTMRAISYAGCNKYFIQKFHTDGVEDEELACGCEICSIPDSAVTLGQELFEVFEVR
ncbi:anaerobic ribonucleoside-triphosphate reductase activating protein [Candidatus Latescibacterota bacterium]